MDEVEEGCVDSLVRAILLMRRGCELDDVKLVRSRGSTCDVLQIGERNMAGVGGSVREDAAEWMRCKAAKTFLPSHIASDELLFYEILY